MIKYLFLLAGIMVGLGLQAQPTFDAYADAERIFEDGYFEVTFTLRNGEPTDFEPPSFRQAGRCQSLHLFFGSVP